MKSPALYAAVYLDRRYSADLCDGEIELAKITLCEMWNRLKIIKKNDDAAQKNDDTNNDGSNNDSKESEEDFLFDMDEYMRSKISRATNNTTQENNEFVASSLSQSHPRTMNYEMSEAEYLLSLDRFETKYPIIESNIDIFEFIEEIKVEFPEIYTVAAILMSIPPS